MVYTAMVTEHLGLRSWVSPTMVTIARAFGRLTFVALPDYSRRRYRLRPRSPLSSAPASSVPGVSILRPLKGLDNNLFENLESTFTQEYPNFEILLSVDDESDQALGVVRELLQKYPNIDAKIIICESYVLLHVFEKYDMLHYR